MVQVDSNEELLATKFAQVDIDKDGKIDASDFLRLCKRIEGASNRPDMINVAQRVLDGSQKYPGNHSGYGTLKDFIRVAEYVKTGNFEELSPETSGAVADSPKVRRSSAKQITRFAGATGSSQHSMEDEELAQYVIHINEALSGDPILSERLPLDPNSHELFPNCADGLLLAKLINVAVPDTIDERVLNTPYQAADLNNHEAPETPKIENKLNGKNFKIRSKNFELNTFQKTENLNLVIASAKGIGCRVVNIGAQDLIEGREHLVLGLVWQIIQRTLLANVSLLRHPELYRLLESGETLEHLLQLSPENLLMRWVNYHLQRAGSTRRLTSFSVDLRDSEIYAILMVQLAPAHFSSPNFVMKYEDMMDRAVRVLEGAEVMNCARYLTPRAIVQGNPRLNLAFLANLFNHLPGLQALTVSERSQLDESLFACADDREGRAFALWLNSLDLGAPDSFVVNSIYEDLKDGIILLYAFDAVRPGTIQWKRVNKRTSTRKF